MAGTQQGEEPHEPDIADFEPAHPISSSTHPRTPRTPEPRQPRDSPPFRQMPQDQINTPQIQHSQYFSVSTSGRSTAVVESGPATPAAEKAVYNHIQVSASGTNMQPLDPRATARTKWVEENLSRGQRPPRATRRT